MAMSFADIGFGASISGAAMSSVGSYYAAESRKSRLAFMASMDELNAQLEEKSAQAALRKGELEAGRYSMKAGQQKGKLRASLASRGVAMGSGNAAEQVASEDIIKETDMNTIQANAVSTAWGHRMEATNYKNKAAMARAEGDSISPGIAAITSLLGSSGRVAGSWYNYRRGS